MRIEKQVQLFDELMERTRKKHKMISELRKQQINTDTTRNTQLATRYFALSLIFPLFLLI